jgi:hypothetical protein
VQVEGAILDPAATGLEGDLTRWHSSSIVKRVNSRAVQTKSGATYAPPAIYPLLILHAVQTKCGAAYATLALHHLLFNFKCCC